MILTPAGVISPSFGEGSCQRHQQIAADAGATAIFAGNPFEQRLRDINAVSQQIQGNFAHYQTVGQHYLGMQPGLRFI